MVTALSLFFSVISKFGLPISHAFPKILKTQQQEVNCIAHLQHTRGIHVYVERIAKEFEDLPKLKLQQELEEMDNYEEMKNTLWTLVDDYSPPEL